MNIRDVLPPGSSPHKIAASFIWLHVDLVRALTGRDPTPIEPIWNDGTD